MRVEAAKLLVDARNAGRAVLEFIEGKSLSDYRADLLLRSAVERQMFILGEALSQLRTRDPAVFERIPDARRIVGFRNLLAHGYGQVDDGRVWDIVENSLPQTLSCIEEMLNEC
ncbi:MAG: hypothetical protein KatS3mg015_1650 [Fimbriimonadales bacterium]|nr:MAG: hypothetical protein KatS3mg015_1650 [Fimbriimonadales bacterium]